MFDGSWQAPIANSVASCATLRQERRPPASAAPASSRRRFTRATGR